MAALAVLLAAVAILAHEVIRRRRVEKALRESETRFRSLTEEASDIVWEVDAEFRCTYVSSNVYEKAGVAASEMVGKSAWTLLGPQNEEMARGVLLGCRARREPFHLMRTHHRRPDGSEFCYETSGVPVFDPHGHLCGYRGVTRDVTARHRAEAALAQSRAMLQLVLDTIPVRVFWKGIDLRYLGCNRPMATDAGLSSPADIVGRDDYDMPWGAEAELYRAVDRRVIETGETCLDYETSQRRTDGRTVWLCTSKAPLRNADGRIVGVLGAYEDVTVRRQAEEDRARLQAQIQQAQKLESLGVLAGGVAHDFNNLLMAILGNADLALREVSPVSPARESLDEIVAASRRAADLCRQMLAYSGKGRYAVGSLDLRQAIEEMVHLLEASVSANAVLRYTFPPSLPRIDGDLPQIRQIIVNLVTNGSEAIGSGSGIVSISAGAMDCDREYLSKTYLDDNLPDGRYVYLEVSDTGCGMDAETCGRIFDPFFSTKFTGRGLGMAAVLGIVRGHHGAIKVYSEIGRGTTVKILFPALPALPYGVGAGAQGFAAGGPEGGGRAAPYTGTVLVVDDDETVRSRATRMLEAAGFSVLVAADGREAIATFGRHADRIDVVLLDLSMPEMDGIETFRELRRVRHNVRVVASSGYDREEATRQFVGKGLAGFIQKPYKREALLACLLAAREGREEARTSTG